MKRFSTFLVIFLFGCVTATGSDMSSWVGQKGPTIYDTNDAYEDGVSIEGFRTEGQIRLETAPTSDYHALRLGDLDTKIHRAVSVASLADPSTELNALSGNFVGEGLLAYQVAATANLYTLYVWDTADSGSESVPYTVDGASSGLWVAIGGQYNTTTTVPSGDLTVTGNLTVNGTSTLTGAATLASTLDVSGATTLDDTTVTPDTAGGLFNILTGNLKVGNGTSGVALDGEDAYVEGTFEVDGTVQFDGAVTAASTLTVSGNSALNGDTALGNGAGDAISITGAVTATGDFTINDNVTITPDTASETVNILTGNLKVGNGTPGLTQDGEDAYVEGTLEADGAVNFGSTMAVADTVTITDISPDLVFDDSTVGEANFSMIADGDVFYIWNDSTAILTLSEAGTLSLDEDLLVDDITFNTDNTFSVGLDATKPLKIWTYALDAQSVVNDGVLTQTGQANLADDLAIGNGSPDVTLNGEDAYVEGTFEVDGAARFDGAITATTDVTISEATPIFAMTDTSSLDADWRIILDSDTFKIQADDGSDGTFEETAISIDSASGNTTVSGNISATGNITPVVTGTGDIGASGNIWDDVYAQTFFTENTQTGDISQSFTSTLAGSASSARTVSCYELEGVTGAQSLATIATASDTHYILDIRVQCYEQSSGGDEASYTVIATYDNDGGVLAESSDTTTELADNLGTASASIAASGTNIVLTVTSGAGTYNMVAWVTMQTLNDD